MSIQLEVAVWKGANDEATSTSPSLTGVVPISLFASSIRKDLMLANLLELVWCFINIKAFVVATSSRKVKMYFSCSYSLSPQSTPPITLL